MDRNNDRDEEFDISWRCPLETNQSSFDLPPPLLVRPLSRGPALNPASAVGVCARRFPPRPDLLQNQKLTTDI